MDAGISIELFWNSSINEILDMISSFQRTEHEKWKNRVIDNFAIAEATALNLASVIFGKNEVKPPKPWDYYTSSFKEEKEAYEEAERKKEWEEYKENRRKYINEFNRRRYG